jgi:hypothetical protein
MGVVPGGIRGLNTHNLKCLSELELKSGSERPGILLAVCACCLRVNASIMSIGLCVNVPLGLGKRLVKNKQIVW